MPTKKVAKAKQTKEEPKQSKVNLEVGLGQKKAKLNLKTTSKVLSIIFYLIWIVIGAFLLVLITQSIRQGVFAGLFGAPAQAPASDSQAASQTIIPGVGLVDVNCVKSALPAATIQKIVNAGDASTLTSDDKTKLEPCILQKEAASPSPGSTPSK